MIQFGAGFSLAEDLGSNAIFNPHVVGSPVARKLFVSEYINDVKSIRNV
jgi:hypothetical protein